MRFGVKFNIVLIRIISQKQIIGLGWPFSYKKRFLKNLKTKDLSENVNKPAKVSICLTQGCIPRSYRLLRTTISEL